MSLNKHFQVYCQSYYKYFEECNVVEVSILTSALYIIQAACNKFRKQIYTCISFTLVVDIKWILQDDCLELYQVRGS